MAHKILTLAIFRSRGILGVSSRPGAAFGALAVLRGRHEREKRLGQHPAARVRRQRPR